MRVSLSSAKAWAVRPRKRATSNMVGKEMEAKLQARACATMVPVAPCFEKKRVSSASSRSPGRPARISLSPKAWQSNDRFGRGGASSPPPVRGRSSVKQPSTDRLDRVVFTKKTSFASAGNTGASSPFSPSAASGMQNVTSSPTAKRTCPQFSLRIGTSRRPRASAAPSLAMAPRPSPSPSAPSSAGCRTTVPENLCSLFTHAAWG
mmetsp:Transcript_80690/g.179275  ORF Transcript_80690/g.179275 Transcript_80690/m.179275 type:complete len:206 (+) Transcript_80690:635-1252(+)